MTDLKYLIITDLDGTLLNYETFSYKPIVSFIKKVITKVITKTINPQIINFVF